MYVLPGKDVCTNIRTYNADGVVVGYWRLVEGYEATAGAVSCFMRLL